MIDLYQGVGVWCFKQDREYVLRISDASSSVVSTDLAECIDRGGVGQADPSVNYGGIGAVIGHELSHHFDDQGRKYDKNGALTDWWTPQDVTRFKAFTDKLVAQYDAYEPLPGLHIKGGLTLGENIADLAGLTVSPDAYHRSFGGKPATMIDGTTGDQRRSEEHTSELQSLMRLSYAVFCLK